MTEHSVGILDYSICLGRTLTPLTLTPKEQSALKWLKRKYRQNWRPAIVLGAAKGMSDAAQARELGLSRNTVRKWRECFQGGGIRALLAAQRSGRKRTISLATEGAILAAYKPGATCRAVAKEHGVSAATVHRIWKKSISALPRKTPTRNRADYMRLLLSLRS